MIGLAEKVRPSGTVLQPHLHLICICTLPPCRPLAAAAAAAAAPAAACYVLGIPAWMVNQRRRRYTDDAGQYKTQLEQFLVGRYYDCTRACTRVVLLHGVVL